RVDSTSSKQKSKRKVKLWQKVEVVAEKAVAAAARAQEVKDKEMLAAGRAVPATHPGEADRTLQAASRTAVISAANSRSRPPQKLKAGGRLPAGPFFASKTRFNSSIPSCRMRSFKAATASGACSPPPRRQ